jgi:hypothetical protein
MEMAWKRMSDAHWRHSYKGMELIHFLIFNGHVRCIDEARARMKMLQGMAIATCPRERDHGEFDAGECFFLVSPWCGCRCSLCP